MKNISIFSNPVKYIIIGLFLLIIGIVALNFGYLKNIVFQSKKPDLKKLAGINQVKSDPQVLGRSYIPPQIYLYGGDQKFAAGGIISLTSLQEPAIEIAGYSISGTAEISIYKANQDALLNYLIHDKDDKQINLNPDINSFEFITKINQTLNSGSNQSTRVILPLEEKGIWYIKIDLPSISADAYVVRSETGTLLKEGENELIFWGQNYKSKRSITEGNLKTVNLENKLTNIENVSFNSEGIAITKLNPEADVAISEVDGDIAIIPINLQYLNTGYSYKRFTPPSRNMRYFIFTDRPLYKPGDKVYFKAVIRNDNDARYTLPSGEAQVKVYNGYYYEGSTIQPVYETGIPISNDGTISGEFTLKDDTKTGYYSLAVTIPNQKTKQNYWDSEYSSNSVSFNVEYFRKPEFTIEASINKRELVAQDEATFEINGKYFSGQPLAAQKIKYAIYAADYYEYENIIDYQNYFQSVNNDYRYGYWGGSNKVSEGIVELDNNGRVEIPVNTKMDFNKGRSQIFSLEATIEDGSQNPVFARANALVYAGEFGIFRKDFNRQFKPNESVKIPVALVSMEGKKTMSGINLKSIPRLTIWEKYLDPNIKEPQYRKIEENLPESSCTTNNRGECNIDFTPTKAGSYQITISGNDKRGNNISKEFYVYVTSDNQPFYTSEEANLTVTSDKSQYLPDDVARITLNSDVADRDIFLALERGRVDRYQIVKMSGKSAAVEIPLLETDMPNIYAHASGFSDMSLDEGSVDLAISTQTKDLKVKITPDSTVYGPGGNVNIDLLTTGNNNQPISAELALWAVDKAIFELSDNKLGNIFKTFWSERGDTTQSSHSLSGIMVRQAEGGGCFVKGTRILMSDGNSKNIENVKTGDYVLTRDLQNNILIKAKVTGTHQATEDGYLIVNNNIKVTANHKLWVNNDWHEAGSIQIGDKLVNSKGIEVTANSIEWQRDIVEVYNLEVEKYHTYFADNVWVHNQKGDARDTFKDTAYWNPRVKTDTNGKARLSFKLPDNLTTWVIAAVGSTPETIVGQNTTEIQVSKSVIVRPVLPNIFRTGDEVMLKAIVQNYTNANQKFNVNLKFDSGRVATPKYEGVQIPANGSKEFFWKVYPEQEKLKSKITTEAIVIDEQNIGDVVVSEIPVYKFGFWEESAQAGQGNKDYLVKLNSDSQAEKTKIDLSVSSNIVGMLPSAMKYLIYYPYGCVEQTTSSLVPAVIAKLNPDIFGGVLKEFDLSQIIQKGIGRLEVLNRGNGWAWWQHGYTSPFVTSYVIEYLLLSRDNGFKVDDQIINYAKTYLENLTNFDNTKNPSDAQKVAGNYGLALLKSQKPLYAVTDLSKLTPDILALYVLTNVIKGDKNSQTNGLDRLIGLAQTQGDIVFWGVGDKENFGSIDASTALAIRAILASGGDRETAVKGVRYLTRNRKFDYWSNTFATAQIVRTLVEYAKSGNELTPNFRYNVGLDGRAIAGDKVVSSKQILSNIIINPGQVKNEGSKITISKDGDGQIYSTLNVKQFRTDKKVKALDNGLNIQRQYLNPKGEQSPIAVGDTVKVVINIGGLKAEEFYAVIKDDLPAGLVPINKSLNNEQFGQSFDTSYQSGISDIEYTENGAVMSLYKIAPGSQTFSYEARAVSSGKFVAPPTTVALMYAPEINGRSDVSQLTIVQDNPMSVLNNLPLKQFKIPSLKNILLFFGVLFSILIVGTIIIFKSGLLKSKTHQKPDGPKIN